MSGVELRFNVLLAEAGIDPAGVRLLRHQTSPVGGRTPYTLWRDDRPAFEGYQSTQDPARRASFNGPYWASFIAPPQGGTLFAGLYAVRLIGCVANGTVDPMTRLAPGHDKGRVYDQYECEPVHSLAPFAGRLFIDWGPGTRSWIQRADLQNKVVVELTREFREEAFPGYTSFVSDLSRLSGLPRGWIEALASVRGVYLLTCPRTGEQYIGSACGADGFLGRWMQYVVSGHGGNAGLKSRDPADYQVSILEVAGSAAGADEIIAVEQLWKRKLQSRDMGLNRN